MHIIIQTYELNHDLMQMKMDENSILFVPISFHHCRQSVDCLMIASSTSSHLSLLFCAMPPLSNHFDVVSILWLFWAARHYAISAFSLFGQYSLHLSSGVFLCLKFVLEQKIQRSSTNICFRRPPACEFFI